MEHETASAAGARAGLLNVERGDEGKLPTACADGAVRIQAQGLHGLLCLHNSGFPFPVRQSYLYAST